ncbi:MAG TPA: thioredoxin domain-containing protein [Candidatus Paceibacterota bacterium]|nr:thioredoxin domain-containing protein [Candidatus Paceibacterota bacterium]
MKKTLSTLTLCALLLLTPITPSSAQVPSQYANLDRAQIEQLIEQIMVLIMTKLGNTTLDSLGEAREKARDATVKTQINNLRAQAEIYYDDNSRSYQGFCQTDIVTEALTGNVPKCQTASQEYRISAPLEDGSYYCIDSQGVAEAVMTTPNGLVCMELEMDDEVSSMSVRPLGEDDHIRGERSAPIALISYMDFESPYSAGFHDTITELTEEFDTEIVWAYRNFPISQLHPNSVDIAVAAECAALLKGNNAYWEFLDELYEEKETNEFTTMDALDDFAARAGVSRTRFAECRELNAMPGVVQEDFDEAIAADVLGVPHTFVYVDGQEGVINGAQTTNTIRNIINNLLQQLGR